MSHRGTKILNALLNIQFPIILIVHMHAKFFNLVPTEYSVVSRRTGIFKKMLLLLHLIILTLVAYYMI